MAGEYKASNSQVPTLLAAGVFSPIELVQKASPWRLKTRQLWADGAHQLWKAILLGDGKLITKPG
jgi:hypothetical protein